MNLTTISEASAVNKINITSIRWQLTKNNIESIDKVKWTLNGYIGQPYKKEDIDKALSGYNLKTAKIEPVEEPKQTFKKYTSYEVCLTLRKHLKSNLCNKVISSWTYKDWLEFENLKKK